MSERILIVDDEKDIADLLEVYLMNENYTIYKYYSAREALAFIENEEADLAILDIMLPDIDGFTLCQKIREKYTYPVIMLTAKDEEMDKITGLTLGADDYIVKPFLPKEFLLRVTALLRRTYGNILPENGFALPDSVYGERQILFDNAVVKCGSEELALTPKELILLKTLYSQKNRIVTSDALTMAAWGDVSYGYENTLMVHIRRLRQKIEENPSSPKHLLTVKGLGYKLVVKQ